MSDRLADIRDRIDRADEQIENLKEQIRQYFQSDSCRYRGEYDADTELTTLSKTVLMPDPRVATITGEIVHDLRSALDHLAWQLVEYVNPGKASQQTCWPVVKIGPLTNHKGSLPCGYIAGGISDVAGELVERGQPYWLGLGVAETEADPVRVLHRMWIADKHRYVAIHGVQAHFSTRGDQPMPSFSWTSEFLRADEYSAELRIVPDDPTVDVEGTATIHVIAPPPPDAPMSLMTTLILASGQVRGIVDEAARTCFG